MNEWAALRQGDEPNSSGVRDGQPAFIVVEGCNGTGKSEIAWHLRHVWRATYYHYPPGFDQLRGLMHLDDSVPPVPRLMYYLAGCTHLSSLIEQDREAGRSVVCDRYLASPMALLVAEGSLSRGLLETLAAPLIARWVKPDLTLLLTSSHAVAVERILNRSSGHESGVLTPVEEKSIKSRDFFHKRAALLREFSLSSSPVIELDTSDLTRAEAVANAEHVIHEFLAKAGRAHDIVANFDVLEAKA